MSSESKTAERLEQSRSAADGVGEPAEVTIVIFGASGDLTARKLLPALFRLWQGGFLGGRSPIVGVARRDKTDAEFRNEMFEAVNRDGRSGRISASQWEAFANRLFYRTVDLSESAAYPALAREIHELERTPEMWTSSL